MNEAFGIGNVLGTGFRIWLKNLVPFVLITAVLYLPVILWGISAASGDATLEHAKRIDQFRQMSGLLTNVLNVIVSAALTYGVVMELQGKRASIGSCVATGFGRFFPTLGVGIVVGLAVIGGMILLIVPGVIAMCMFYVAMPASVIEKAGVSAAMKRSRELTDGNKGQIFGLALLLGLMAIGVAFAAGAILLTTPSAGIEAYLAGYERLIYVQLGIHVVFGSLSAVMAAVAYYYLRNEKEGTTANELALVFE
jgi:hypothetical protein